MPSTHEIAVDSAPLYRLSPYLFMQFAEPLGTADSSIDAAWDFVNRRWRKSTLAIVKELSPTMIRWGGGFSSYYHWREGVGPERVPMYNLCWDGIYLNQVGTAELAELARSVGAELLLAVNFLSDGQPRWYEAVPGDCRIGTAEEAADWVRYCNDPDDALRRSHGVEEPYRVRYWQIGNETGYRAPVLEHPGFSREENPVRAAEFIAAMRGADPSIRLIVWGDGPNQVWKQRYLAGENSDWCAAVCEGVGDGAELVAFHNHFGGGEEFAALQGLEYRKDPARTWSELWRAAADFEARIEYMRRSVLPYGRKLAMTEGHLAQAGRERSGLMASWAAGAMYAGCYNTLQRHGDVIEIATLADFMGNRWNSNAIILPSPEWFGTPPFLLPSGRIAALYRAHIGESAVKVAAPPAVDAVASRTGEKIFCHLVNRERNTPCRITLSVDGRAVSRFRVWEIAADPEAEITELCPHLFDPREFAVDGGEYTLAGAAVAVIEAEL